MISRISPNISLMTEQEMNIEIENITGEIWKPDDNINENSCIVNKMKYPNYWKFMNLQRVVCDRNITMEDFVKLYDIQNGCCAICGKQVDISNRRNLYIDHN